MARHLIGATLILMFTACGGSKASEQEPKAGEQPPATETAKEPTKEPAAAEMTLEQAKQIVAKGQEGKVTLDDPLLQPKSLDDVMEILHRDQLDLFASGVGFTGGQDDVKAKALHAQIELAWADANTVLADVLREQAAHTRARKRVLDGKKADGSITPEEQSELDEMSARIGAGTELADALIIIGREHLNAGSELAKAIIAQKPDEYLGYRVAADYYRLSQDWPNFEAMVKKIEETNPESNGLVFLHGVAAADRDNDRAKAAELFRAALAKDAKFTRAQAYLVLWADSVEAQYEALTKLEALNANHQIVKWAGEHINKNYEARKK